MRVAWFIEAWLLAVVITTVCGLTAMGIVFGVFMPILETFFGMPDFRHGYGGYR